MWGSASQGSPGMRRASSRLSCCGSLLRLSVQRTARSPHWFMMFGRVGPPELDGPLRPCWQRRSCSLQVRFLADLTVAFPLRASRKRGFARPRLRQPSICGVWPPGPPAVLLQDSRPPRPPARCPGSLEIVGFRRSGGGAGAGRVSTRRASSSLNLTLSTERRLAPENACWMVSNLSLAVLGLPPVSRATWDGRISRRVVATRRTVKNQARRGAWLRCSKVPAVGWTWLPQRSQEEERLDRTR